MNNIEDTLTRSSIISLMAATTITTDKGKAIV